MTDGGTISYVSAEITEEMHQRYDKALDDLEEELGRSYRMQIGGREVGAVHSFDIRSPVDSTLLIGTFPSASHGDIAGAIEEACHAEGDWAGRDWKERVRILRDIAGRIERDAFRLAALLTLEVGKNRAEALAEVGETVAILLYYCACIDREGGYTRSLPPPGPGMRCESVMRPFGTWAVIAPFNFPLAIAAGMSAGALITGNTVVFKPTSLAPLTGLALYRHCVEGGVPPGAINLVTGPGEVFGEVVAAHKDVDGIAFTGSRAVGMWLYRTLAARQPYPKPIVAEMGSKNPVIVTESADPDAAADGVARAAFGYSGQKCSATSRVYVDVSVEDAFLDRLVARTEALAIGDPRERETFVGPLITSHALETFRGAVAEAERDGGRVLVGGEILREGTLARGYYAQPTVVTNLPREHRLLREELFMPFVAVQTVGSLDEALKESNDTEYGLTAGIFSGNESDIHAFFSGIHFGVVYVNRRGGATTGAWPGSQPFGGWNASGLTGKGAGGPYYLLSFLREQSRTRDAASH